MTAAVATQKNRRAGMILAGVALGMVGMAYAAVPLYEIFCQVTGYGGTTQKAEGNERVILDRSVKMNFTANTHRDMPWDFRPSQLNQELKVGETMVATYYAHNPTDKIITATAVFNVSPFKVGPYFNKIECFCFTEQTLGPGETAEMPVTYYIDPEIADDPDMDGVSEITLSYTFYVSETEKVPAMDHEKMAGMKEKQDS